MTMDLGTLAILFPMLFLLLGLGVTVVIDPYIQQKQRRIMLLIVVLCLSLIVQNLWENELFVSHSHLALKNLLSAYGYSVRPVRIFCRPMVILSGPFFLSCFFLLSGRKGKCGPRGRLQGSMPRFTSVPPLQNFVLRSGNLTLPPCGGRCILLAF